MTTLSDLHDRGDGYYLLEQEGDADGRRFEILRADGFNFGSTAESEIERVIEQDQASPAPDTGYRLTDFVPDPGATEPEVEDVEPEADGLTELFNGDGVSIVNGEPAEQVAAADEQ